jgi:serine/threonine-protein kinase
MIETGNEHGSAGVGVLDSSLEPILAEQVRDWMRGECKPAKDYLSRQPSLLGHAEAMMELINQEIVLRRRKGETPRLGDYLTDFPELSGPLSHLFDVHNAISLPISLDAAPAVPVVADGALEDRAIRGAPRISGYQIERVLGSGGMGVVYLADDLALNRKVALKILRQGVQDDPGHRGRFEREAAAAAKCQHPNLVQIFEIGEFQGEFYLALEYVEGETLAKAMAGLPQPPREAAGLVEKLARAIEHVHGRGVVHRDLKPANVLLTLAGEPKITDFGLARLDDRSTRTEVGTLLGTLAYMAPEQASGGAVEVGAPADIHALGAILYEALTGRPPYRGDSPEKTLQKILFEDVVPPSNLQPEIPRDLEAISLKCLEKSPNHRYASAVELAEDLRRFLDGRPIFARPVRLWERSWRWCRRNPKLATVSAVLAATVLVAIGAFVGMTYRHNLQLRAEVRRTQAKADEARKNYQEARSTIQAMLKRLDDSRVTGVPRLLDLRRSLQEDALAFYDQILRQVDSNDPFVRADSARALCDAAPLQHALGQSDVALDTVRRALRLVEGLMSERPDDLEYMVLKRDCLIKLGPLLSVARRSPDEVITACRESVELADRVAKARPDDMHHQGALAACRMNYGNALKELKKVSEAIVQYRKATKIRKAIDPSKLPGVTLRLAGSLVNEGVILCGQQDYSQAEERFKEAEQHVLRAPTDVRGPDGGPAYAYGQVMVNWGGMLLPMGHFNEAIDRADAGLRQVEPKLRIEPNDVRLRDICLELHGNKGYALGGLGRHRESAAEWTRVVELSPKPVPPDYRIQLAMALARAGEDAKALDQAPLAEQYPDITGTDRYNLGALFALCAASAQNDRRILPAQRTRLVESHVREALRRLTSAAKAGFFNDPAMRDAAKKDPDVAILAGRPEFRAIIEAPQIKH